MSDVVLAALIGAVVSLVGSILNNWTQRKKKAVEEAAEKAELHLRLKSIEDKLDTHNGYAEKLTEMDKNIAVITERIKNIKEVRA